MRTMLLEYLPTFFGGDFFRVSSSIGWFIPAALASHRSRRKFLSFQWYRCLGVGNSRCLATPQVTFCDQLAVIIWTGWWLGHPSEKYEFVNWDDDIPNINGKIKLMFQTTNQLPSLKFDPPSNPLDVDLQVDRTCLSDMENLDILDISTSCFRASSTILLGARYTDTTMKTNILAISVILQKKEYQHHFGMKIETLNLRLLWFKFWGSLCQKSICWLIPDTTR